MADRKAALAGEVSALVEGHDRLLGVLGQDADLDLTLLNVDDGIRRVTLPVAAPAIAAAAAIVFVGMWNDFVFAAVIGGRDTSTLPRYLGETFTPQYHVLAARIVLTVAPCIALVALFRRRILGFG